ncbi:MAG: hypothetical protein ACRER2_15330, partial [Methylococcales bacterium]
LRLQGLWLPPAWTSTTLTVHHHGRTRSGGSRLRRPDGGSRPPPWQDCLPARMARTLSASREYLLGLSLLLYYRPSRSRSPRFAAEVLGWWRERSLSTPPQPRQGIRRNPAGNFRTPRP